MKIKYCPICKSELDYAYIYLGGDLCCKYKIFHFQINEDKINIFSYDFGLKIILLEDQYCKVDVYINKEYKEYELTSEFFYKAIRILENNEGILKLKMLIKEIDNLLIFQ